MQCHTHEQKTHVPPCLQMMMHLLGVFAVFQKNLGGKVTQCAHYESQTDILGPVHLPTQAQVGQLHHTGLGNQKVVRFDVPVEDLVR